MKNEAIVKTALMCIAVILTGFILGNAFKKRNASLDSISVTGLGTKDFISDEILFNGSYSVKAADAREAYAIITADKEKVKSFFLSKGFTANEFTFSGAAIEKAFRTVTIENENGNTKTEQTEDGYTGTQSIWISSKKNAALMKKIEDVSDQTSELINSGIEFKASAIQYTYSDLPSLKHNLIENATKDARERAEKIIQTAHGDIGKLKTASMGVFQITGKGSEEEDSYGGNNDVYSKEKTARITVRLEYELE